MAGQGSFPQELTYDNSYYNPLYINPPENYYMPNTIYTYQEAQQSAQPLVTFYDSLNSDISNSRAKIKLFEEQLLLEQHVLKQKEEQWTNKQAEDDRLRREEEEKRKLEETTEAAAILTGTTTTTTTTTTTLLASQILEEAARLTFSQVMLPEITIQPELMTQTEESVDVSYLEEARQDRVNKRQKREVAALATQGKQTDWPRG